MAIDHLTQDLKALINGEGVDLVEMALMDRIQETLYATIRGVITAVSEYDNDPKTGYNRTNHKGEYWFEK